VWKKISEVYRVRKMHWILCGVAAHYLSEDFQNLAGGLFQHLFLSRPGRRETLSLGPSLACGRQENVKSTDGSCRCAPDL